MVHDWYRATSAWMILNEDHDTKHFDRAREIFPNDQDILFLSGCQHEAYARPLLQSAVQTAVLPTKFSIDVDSARLELGRAESFFRGALSQDPERWSWCGGEHPAERHFMRRPTRSRPCCSCC
jgi:hypothetical protein